MKKAKKQIMGLVGTSMIGAAGASALGSIGGDVATYGQKGISNMSKMMPAMGSVMGAGMITRGADNLWRQSRYKRKRRK